MRSRQTGCGNAWRDSRRRFEAEADLSEQTRQALEEEIQQYETYVSADGERRQEVEALVGQSQSNIELVNGVIQEAEAVMEAIDSWEPEDDEDSLDEGALWEPVEESWEQYPVLGLNLTFGVQDKETEGLLERISQFMRRGFWGLCFRRGQRSPRRYLTFRVFPHLRRAEELPAARRQAREIFWSG